MTPPAPEEEKEKKTFSHYESEEAMGWMVAIDGSSRDFATYNQVENQDGKTISIFSDLEVLRHSEPDNTEYIIVIACEVCLSNNSELGSRVQLSKVGSRLDQCVGICVS